MNMVTSCLPFLNIYYDVKGIHTAASNLKSKVDRVSQDRTWRREYIRKQYEREVTSLRNKFSVGLLFQFAITSVATITGALAIGAILTVGIVLSVGYLASRPTIKQKIENGFAIPKPTIA